MLLSLFYSLPAGILMKYGVYGSIPHNGMVERLWIQYKFLCGTLEARVESHDLFLGQERFSFKWKIVLIIVQVQDIIHDYRSQRISYGREMKTPE